MSDKRINKTLKTLSKIQKEMESIEEFDYDIRCLQFARKELLKRLPFKVGAKVKIKKTPVIDTRTSPGWLCCKHYLIKGATGVVKGIVIADTHIGYYIDIDYQSSIFNGEETVYAKKDHHIFHFREDMLESVSKIKIRRQENERMERD